MESFGSIHHAAEYPTKMRLVLLSELAGKEQSVHMLENYTKNAKSDNLDYCWCWWLRGDMCLVNIGKRMVPQSLLSGVWENVKLSRILGFMSRELITQYFLFSLKYSHASWNQQMPWSEKKWPKVILGGSDLSGKLLGFLVQSFT